MFQSTFKFLTSSSSSSSHRQHQQRQHSTRILSFLVQKMKTHLEYSSPRLFQEKMKWTTKSRVRLAVNISNLIVVGGNATNNNLPMTTPQQQSMNTMIAKSSIDSDVGFIVKKILHPEIVVVSDVASELHLLAMNENSNNTNNNNNSTKQQQQQHQQKLEQQLPLFLSSKSAEFICNAIEDIIINSSQKRNKGIFKTKEEEEEEMKARERCCRSLLGSITQSLPSGIDSIISREENIENQKRRGGKSSNVSKNTKKKKYYLHPAVMNTNQHNINNNNNIHWNDMYHVSYVISKALYILSLETETESSSPSSVTTTSYKNNKNNKNKISDSGEISKWSAFDVPTSRHFIDVAIESCRRVIKSQQQRLIVIMSSSKNKNKDNNSEDGNNKNNNTKSENEEEISLSATRLTGILNMLTSLHNASTAWLPKHRYDRVMNIRRDAQRAAEKEILKCSKSVMEELIFVLSSSSSDSSSSASSSLLFLQLNKKQMMQIVSSLSFMHLYSYQLLKYFSPTIFTLDAKFFGEESFSSSNNNNNNKKNNFLKFESATISFMMNSLQQKQGKPSSSPELLSLSENNNNNTSNKTKNESEKEKETFFQLSQQVDLFVLKRLRYLKTFLIQEYEKTSSSNSKQKGNNNKSLENQGKKQFQAIEKRKHQFQDFTFRMLRFFIRCESIKLQNSHSFFLMNILIPIIFSQELSFVGSRASWLDLKDCCKFLTVLRNMYDDEFYDVEINQKRKEKQGEREEEEKSKNDQIQIDLTLASKNLIDSLENVVKEMKELKKIEQEQRDNKIKKRETSSSSSGSFFLLTPPSSNSAFPFIRNSTFIADVKLLLHVSPSLVEFLMSTLHFFPQRNKNENQKDKFSEIVVGLILDPIYEICTEEERKASKKDNKTNNNNNNISGREWEQITKVIVETVIEVCRKKANSSSGSEERRRTRTEKNSLFQLDFVLPEGVRIWIENKYKEQEILSSSSSSKMYLLDSCSLTHQHIIDENEKVKKEEEYLKKSQQVHQKRVAVSYDHDHHDDHHDDDSDFLDVL